MQSEGQDPIKTELTNADRVELQQLSRHPGWATVLRLMDMECVLQDARLMAVPAAEEKAVLAEHRRAQAMWEFNASIRKQIEFEVSELTAARNRQQPGAELAAILDATKENQE